MEADLNDRRQVEFDAYGWLYRERKYGEQTPRHAALREIMRGQMPVRSWLDVGCGTFDLSDVFPGICRTDPAFGGVPLHRFRERVRFTSDPPGLRRVEFDLVTAFDVLEHLLPEELDDGIRILASIAERVIVSVGTDQSVWDGHRCHQTVMGPRSWEERLRGLWGNCEALGAAHGSPCFIGRSPWQIGNG